MPDAATTTITATLLASLAGISDAPDPARAGKYQESVDRVYAVDG